MKKHFSRHISYLLSCEISVPNNPISTAEIDQHLCVGFIHGQCKPITLDPFLITKCFCKCFPQGNTSVFNGMMLVDLKIAICLNGEVKLAVPRNLLQHVVEKAKPG